MKKFMFFAMGIIAMATSMVSCNTKATKENDSVKNDTVVVDSNSQTDSNITINDSPRVSQG